VRVAARSGFLVAHPDGRIQSDQPCPVLWTLDKGIRDIAVKNGYHVRTHLRAEQVAAQLLEVSHGDIARLEMMFDIRALCGPSGELPRTGRLDVPGKFGRHQEREEGVAPGGLLGPEDIFVVGSVEGLDTSRLQAELRLPALVALNQFVDLKVALAVHLTHDVVQSRRCFSLADFDLGRQQFSGATDHVPIPLGREVTYKNLHADRYQLVSGKPSRRRYEALKLCQGNAFVRRFWLNSLGQTRKLVAYFNGPRRETKAPVSEEYSVSESGGDWFIQVNDRQYFLRDQRGIQIGTHSSPSPAVYGAHWYEYREDCPYACWSVPFEIPLGDINEEGWNTIGIGNAGSGGEFMWFGETDNAYEPKEACLCQVG